MWKFAEVINTSYEFPCQFGYEEGLCSDKTFAGLCPHTCQPLIHTHLGTATSPGGHRWLVWSSGTPPGVSSSRRRLVFEFQAA